MKPFFLALPFVAFAASAKAQDVLFRSGEHEDFTRLVATLPSPDTEWSIERRAGNIYRIKIEGENLNLRTNRIFDRIPRTRLSSVKTDSREGEVELSLACACRVVSIPYNERYVIFDIREGNPIEPEEAPALPLSFGTAVPKYTPERVFRFSALEASKPVQPASEVAKPAVQKPDFSGLLALENYVQRNLDVTTLRQDLVKQVDRAATQKLLDTKPLAPVKELAATSIEQATGQQFKTPSQNVVIPQHIPEQAVTELEDRDLNIVAYNVIDEVGRDIAELLSGRASARTCLPDTAVNISDWSGKKSFTKELAALRQKLVGEFDRTNENALKELAKLYIHYTFGAEAIQALDLLPKSEETEILRSMANLVDGNQMIKEDNFFANQGHCSGHVALWAALSSARLTGESAALGARDALAEMPRHLREHLGPELSNRLVAQGDTESATLILNSIDRTNPDPDARYDFAHATLDAELGNTEKATETLEEIATQNSDMATFAVLELIDSHVQQSAAPSSDTVSLVGALAVEHKSGALGPSLRRAHALARMLEQKFEPAYQIVSEIEERDGAKAAVEVRDLVTSAAIDSADEFSLLNYTITENLSEPGRIKPDTALALAEKLFDLGFLGETRRLLQAAQNSHKKEKMQLLKARVALAEEMPRRAEAELLGLKSKEADRLRAAAKSLAGDHEMAAQLLAKIGESSQAETENWLGGNLPALAASETEVYREASKILQRSEAQPEEFAGSDDRVTLGVLERNRALIDESLNSRNLLGSLLELHQLSEPSS